MRRNKTPLLDPRDAEQVFKELLARGPDYVPELTPAEGGPAQALMQIFARYMEVIIHRLNQTPDKNLLAFLDMLGISLIPPQSARAPVVFKPLPNAGNGRIAARTRLGAQVPDRPNPLMFETENAIAMAAARLVEVKTLWPAHDEYADHTAEFAGGRAFTLFKPSQPVPHEFYVAHDTLFAFAGEATVELEFELATLASEPLEIAWEFWDGQLWRPFRPFDSNDQTASEDGTEGLSRSGVVRLRAECGETEKRAVSEIEAHWVRGRLDQSLPPDPAQVLPEVDRVRVRSVINRPLWLFVGIPISTEAAQQIGPLGPRGILPDIAFSNGTQIDLSRQFYPLGTNPDNHSVFFFSSEELLSKPGAYVTMSFNKVITPEEEADSHLEQYKPDVNEAMALINAVGNKILTAAVKAAEAIQHSAQSLIEIAANNDALTELKERKEVLRKIIVATPVTVDDLLDAAVQVVSAMKDLSTSTIIIWLPRLGKRFVAEEDDIDTTFQESGVAAGKAREAVKSAQTALQSLSDLSPIEAAAVGREESPKLSPPRLIWEYWNGKNWKRLVGPVDDEPINLLAAGEVSFRVPFDLERTEINGTTALWVRVRLLNGSYNRLRLVSWYDSQSDNINFFPIIEPRPPVLALFSFGYTYRSAWEQPEHCLTHDDFQFELHSRNVRVPGGVFPPFRPVPDVTPALYLGFDQPLPNDLISLYMDIEERDVFPLPLVWEAWDGVRWRELSAADGTAGLQRPGMLSFIAPDVAPRAQAAVSQASGTRITASDALESAIFQPGDRVIVRQDKTHEMVTVQKVEDSAVIFLETPLKETYRGGTVTLAALPRFGTPLDWIRVRLKEDGAPPKSLIHGIHLNATWAAQVQSLNDEMLGSGTGQKNQPLFFSQAPVLPGERIEVRELEGARAEVEQPILQAQLLKLGLTEDDIRSVVDPRSGAVTEVWVRWQFRPHLFYSGPDDRHYMLERTGGRLIFGDGQHGRIPTVGANNILVRRYQTGGGLVGNVPANAIDQLLGVAPFVQGVTNPVAAEGGADAETVTNVRTRGPHTLRHRGRSLSTADYEALAQAASPGVAIARALPATAPNGRPAPGWITLIIVPHSLEPEPQPSVELRRQVHDYLAERAPSSMDPGRIAVVGPTYLPIGIEAFIASHDVNEAGTVEERVQLALQRFLHPLTGGPEGLGWPFGRNVYLSDAAALLESVNGVDYVRELNLLLRNTPRGEQVVVPPDRIVVAGSIRIEMETPENLYGGT